MGWCKKYVAPLLTHWSYILLALTHLYLYCCTIGVSLFRDENKSPPSQPFSRCLQLINCPPSTLVECQGGGWLVIRLWSCSTDMKIQICCIFSMIYNSCWQENLNAYPHSMKWNNVQLHWHVNMKTIHWNMKSYIEWIKRILDKSSVMMTGIAFDKCQNNLFMNSLSRGGSCHSNFGYINPILVFRGYICIYMQTSAEYEYLDYIYMYIILLDSDIFFYLTCL